MLPIDPFDSLISAEPGRFHAVEPSPSAGASHLRIGRCIQPRAVILVLAGEIDLASAPALARQLEDAEQLLADEITLDMGAVGFIDSSGLQVLIAATRRAGRNGHLLRLTNVPAQAQRLFDVTGVQDHLRVT